MRIVYDLDGVLNTMNEAVFKALGIEHKREKVKHYNIRSNIELLTAGEMAGILEMYGEPSIYRDTQPAIGASRITEIEGAYDVEVFVHTLCLNEEIAEVKREWILRNTGVGVDKIITDIGYGKNILDNVDILVEDCLENLAKSKAVVKILIDKSYNKLINCEFDGGGIIRVSNLNKAVNTVENIVGELYGKH